MDTAVDGAVFFQDLLGLQQIFQMGIHREVRELPLDDPGEPNQRTHIKELNGPEAFFTPKDLETSFFKFSG